MACTPHTEGTEGRVQRERCNMKSNLVRLSAAMGGSLPCRLHIGSLVLLTHQEQLVSSGRERIHRHALRGAATLDESHIRCPVTPA